MSELTRRVLFSIVAAPLAVAIVLVGSWPLAALLAVTSALAAWEFFRFAQADGLMPLEDLGIALAGIVPLLVHAQYLGLVSFPLFVLPLVVLAILALAIWMRGTSGHPLGAVGSTVLGIAYTGGMLSFGYAIRYHDYTIGAVEVPVGGRSIGIPAGGLLLVLPLLLTWGTDIGAYFVGRAFGKRKLIPAVSPGKTIAGAWGGLLASVIISWLYVRYVLRPTTHLSMSDASVIAFGIIVSVAAQLGDLVESLLKREAGVKDSSHLIPGHGGVLDRIDSLLFVLPVSYALLSWLLVWAP